MSLDMQVNASLKPFNSFGVDVKASLFAQAHNDDDVRQALLCAAEHKLPLLVIGGGSNLLLIARLDGLPLTRRRWVGVFGGPDIIENSY